MKTKPMIKTAGFIILATLFCALARPALATTTVTVTSPNGGENWTAGSTYNVTWSISGTTTSINYQLVALSTDGGSTYNNIGSTQTPSSRSMSWTIPAGTSSTQVRIRVRALDINANILGQDTSDANFTISAPVVNPTVTVTSPNGGESWTAGSTYNVTWSISGTTTSINYQLVALSTDGGSTYNNIGSTQTPSSRSMSWTIPAGTSSTQVRIRVRALDINANILAQDTSDSNFTISVPVVNPTVTVSSPNGGENWTAGSTYNVTWSISGTTTSINYQLVALSTDGGSTYNNIGSTQTPSSRSMSWTIPAGTSSTQVRIRVRALDINANILAQDTSDNNFTISVPVINPTVTVTSPNGGESWTAGNTYNVTWSISGTTTSINYQLVAISTDGGSTYNNIGSTQTPSSRSMSWTIPAGTSSTQVRIRVRALDINANILAQDTSDNNFTISVPVVNPTVTVTSPNGGESWTAGSTYNVTWSISGDTSQINYQLVALSTDGGGTYNNIGSTQTPSSRSMSWTIPAGTSSTQVRIRVRALDVSANILAQDTSDNNFTISVPVVNPTLTVSSPNGGESWTAGNTYNVTWSISGDTSQINYQLVALSTDGGVTYNNVGSTQTPSSRSMSWTIPAGTSSTQVRIRVRALDVSANILAQDASDNNFTISVPVVNPTMTVTSPNGGESWTAGNTYNVTWSISGTTTSINYQLVALSTDGGVTYNNIGSTQTPSSRSMSWTIPAGTSSTQVRIRVRALDINANILAQDTSDANFTISAAVVVAPTVQTLAATAITTSSAELNGYINPNGGATTVYYKYGLTPSYGSITASGNFGTTPQNVGFVQTGLLPNSIYHYCIIASNSRGTSQGLDATFTTLPTSTTAQQAWVAGTSGLGLRLRSSPSLSASILLVMPEGSAVTLLSDTQTADGYLWRHVTYASQTGWADAEYLVFFQGTPTPPAVPITLRQLQADGFSPIASGGSATSSSVVLAATPSGSSAQQFSVQFEIRPSGTAFSNPTVTTTPVQGGAEAQATISSLSNQSYHWRARVLDGNGVPSSWVSFSGNSTDFTVNASTKPLASFSWSPAQVFTGNPITFTAQAASQSGLTFGWNFGGTQTATGGTVSQTFSQSGDVVVTLTVTDSQNNQSQKSQTVSVASTDLVSRINAAAGQSEAMLDDILANATLASGAADYFKEGVENAPLDIGVQAALTGLSLIMGSTDNELDLASRCEDWARQEYGNAAANDLAAQFAPHFVANDSIDHFRDAFVSWAVGKVASGGSQSYQQMWMPGLTSYVALKKAEIEQKRQQAVTAAGLLNPTESTLLVQNLQSRLLGNYALQASYDANANLPISFQSYKSSDETGWTTYNIGQHLFSTSVSLLGTALGGMGGIVAGVAATSSQAELDIFNTLASQSAEVQLMSLSLNVAGQGQALVSQISTNIETGLNDVINSQMPTTSTGTINSISAYSQGTYFSTVDLTARWFATAAYSEIVVQNTGTRTATYRVEAFLTKTFVTGQLPVNFLGLGQRKYDFQVAVAQDSISLTPGGQTTVRLNFMNGDGGSIPEGQDITYVLTARMSDGYYRQDSQIRHFGTTYLDQNGNPVDPALVAAATVSQQPLQSSLLMFPGTNICELKITVQNPFETPVMFNLGQNLPSGAVVINAAGGAYSNNSLSWQLNMQPGELQYFQVVLQLPLPVSNPPVTSTTASAYDSVNATWVQFTNAPAVSQMISTPPPQIQPAGFASGSFGLNVQAPIPGIYRIDATSDFINWNPVLIVTNDAGSFQIMDSDAQNHSARFYRASRR